MAKDNLFLGMARGSIGDVTFSRLNGQQVSRARNRSPRNPKTNAQLAQRAIMATVLQAYRTGRAIFDHSFQGKSAGSPNMRYFMSENLKKLRALIAADIENATPVTEQKGRVVGPGVSYPVGFYRMLLSEGEYPQQAFTVSELDAESDTTLHTLPAANANEKRNEYAARVGLIADDVYTFVGFHGEPEGSNEVFVTPGVSGYGGLQYGEQFYFVRLIVKSSFTSSDAAMAGTTYADMFEVESASAGYLNTLGAKVFSSSVDVSDFFDVDANNDVWWIGLIRSRKDVDLRSTTQLLPGNTFTLETGIISQYVLDAWAAGTTRVGDSSLILEGGNF